MSRAGSEPEPELLRLAGKGLKQLAADPACRAAFASSPLLAEVLAPAAFRYIAAADQDELFSRFTVLERLGYRTGAEYVGEEARGSDEVREVVDEYLRFVDRHAEHRPVHPVQLGFDLSNVGSLVSGETAYKNTMRILEAAAPQQMSILISMERSSFVDGILDLFDRLAGQCENIALTVQAHLHRTEADLEAILPHGRKIRLVKGVYNEPESVALPRGPMLDERYARLLERILDSDCPVAVATHDAALLELLEERELLDRAEEIEMLHGVQPGVLKMYKDRGFSCRVSAVYGQNWWLHFLHRLAEYPPNILTALADLHEPQRVRFASEY